MGPMNQNKIFYGKSVHGNEEIRAVVSTIKNSTQMGKNVSSFETKFLNCLTKVWSHGKLWIISYTLVV